MMNFYKDGSTVEKTLIFKLTLEQKFLLEYTGKAFSPGEAEKIWPRVIDHKWYMSECLKRDVGLRVAAIDYIRNFHTASGYENKVNFAGSLQRLFRTVFYSVGPPPVRRKYTY